MPTPRKAGSTYPNRGMPAAERLALHTVPEALTGCHLCWLAPNRKGYPSFQWKGRSLGAHRAAYMMARGPIPDGMVVCHRCDTPACVNIDHLFLGTAEDNNADRDAKSRQSRGENHSLAMKGAWVRRKASFQKSERAHGE